MYSYYMNIHIQLYSDTLKVLRLRDEFHIFATDDGRLSMAGINAGNVKYIAKAIHTVTSN